jgi:hypothetical protein
VAERQRLDQLQTVMNRCPVSVRGNTEFSDASTKFKSISWAAQQRAYQAIIAAARGDF